MLLPGAEGIATARRPDAVRLRVALARVLPLDASLAVRLAAHLAVKMAEAVAQALFRAAAQFSDLLAERPRFSPFQQAQSKARRLPAEL